MILILKLFFKEEKLLFFITNLRAFCIQFLQIFPSESAGNTLRFRGKKTVYFSDEVFSLGMPSICPHVTTVYLCPWTLWQFKKWYKVSHYRAITINFWQARPSLGCRHLVLFLKIHARPRSCRSSPHGGRWSHSCLTLFWCDLRNML